jgi:hypothetical protein
MTEASLAHRFARQVRLGQKIEWGILRGNCDKSLYQNRSTLVS